MSGTMTGPNWDLYIKTVNAFSDSVSDQLVTWRRLTNKLDRWQEGAEKGFEDIEIKTLVAYNTFRTWPVDSKTPSGLVDKEYCHLYLNIQYLRDNGWMTAENQFDFNPGYDRFIVNGLEYSPSGDTGTGQANVNPVFIIVILERETIATGNNARV